MTETGFPGTQNQMALRRKGRDRAEARFRLYGRLAIGLAVGILLILLARIVQQGYQALWVYEFHLPVSLKEEVVDPEGKRDPEALRRADYVRLLQGAFRSQVPSVKGRRNLRELFQLYAPLNASRLLKEVVHHPEKTGTEIIFSMPVADEADLYFKGRLAKREVSEPDTLLSLLPGGEEGKSPGRSAGIVFQASSPVFEPFYISLKNQILATAENLERQAEEQEERLRQRGQGGEDSGLWEKKIHALRLKAENLRQVYDKQGRLTLSESVFSLLIEAGGGIFKVRELGPDNVVTVPLISGTQEEGAFQPGNWRLMKILTPQAQRRLKDQQIAWLEDLHKRSLIRKDFNRYLFLNPDSREPELAGIASAFWGSLIVLLVTMGLAVPLGVGAALYLEEFAPRNRWTDFIEVNINNLAAVPSIIFGLLGLAVFINFFHVPRSTPLVGGMVLALMTLPTVIIATRAALKAVPGSIRQAALAVGASRVQTVFHHVLPLALPGIMTGSIIGLAQAMGETAPLLIVGMVAFIADLPPFAEAFSQASNLATGLKDAVVHVPDAFTSPSTVMPVQVYLWSDAAQRAFEQRTAAAIAILLIMVILLNGLAVYLRRRYERRW